MGCYFERYGNNWHSITKFDFFYVRFSNYSDLSLGKGPFWRKFNYYRINIFKIFVYSDI